MLDVLAACFRLGEMDTDTRAAEFQRLIGVRKSVLANLPQRAKGKKHGTYAVQETVARSAIPKQSQAANGGPEAHRFLARNRRAAITSPSIRTSRKTSRI